MDNEKIDSVHRKHYEMERMWLLVTTIYQLDLSYLLSKCLQILVPGPSIFQACRIWLEAVLSLLKLEWTMRKRQLPYLIQTSLSVLANSMCAPFFPAFQELGLHELYSSILLLSCFASMPGCLAISFRIFCIRFVVRVALGLWPFLTHSPLNKILKMFALLGTCF